MGVETGKEPDPRPAYVASTSLYIGAHDIRHLGVYAVWKVDGGHPQHLIPLHRLVFKGHTRHSGVKPEPPVSPLQVHVQVIAHHLVNKVVKKSVKSS